MTTFAGKTAASPDKVRGGYYTPAAVARFLARWVRAAGPKILEPSCGDGAILRELAALSDRARGVELVAPEAAKARAYAPVDTENLFTWLRDSEAGGWDAVAGNPPYIRFGNWASEQREPALELMRRSGLRPTRLTNAWVPFVVASTILTRDGGRVGLVLPAELLQVTYAAQLREFLLSRFAEITLVTFERLVFDGILQEVVLFCGVGSDARPGADTHGPPRRCRRAAAPSWTSNAFRSGPALLHESEKWTKYFLQPDQIQLLRTLKRSDTMTSLGPGGRRGRGHRDRPQQLLHLHRRPSPGAGTDSRTASRSSRAARSCPAWSTTTTAAQPISPRSTGPGCSTRRTTRPIRPCSRTSMRVRPPGVHTGYKCSIRTPWWSTPSLWFPDLFMLRQIHRAPRLTVNAAAATSTDTVHRVRVNARRRPRRALAAVFHNSATFAFAEIMGRSYGGGILELEPGEAEQLPIPPPAYANTDLAADVDLLLKANEIDKALDVVDRHVLVDGLGWSPDVVAQCRSAWVALRERRTKRGSR